MGMCGLLCNLLLCNVHIKNVELLILSQFRAVKGLNHPQGDPVTGSGRYRQSLLKSGIEA